MTSCRSSESGESDSVPPRLDCEVVSIFGDGDYGAGEIHTRAGVKFRGDAKRGKLPSNCDWIVDHERMQIDNGLPVNQKHGRYQEMMNS